MEETTCVDGRIILKTILEKQGVSSEPYSSGSRQGTENMVMKI
jgi:hypothetical protein